MYDSEETPVTEAPPARKGRPTGRPDATQRKRRTAQEISDDKIRVAQMKLDALRETEREKLTNKRPRAQQAQTRVSKPKPVPQPEPDSDSDGAPGLPDPRTSRQVLYDSWFEKR